MFSSSFTYKISTRETQGELEKFFSVEMIYIALCKLSPFQPGFCPFWNNIFHGSPRFDYQKSAGRRESTENLHILNSIIKCASQSFSQSKTKRIIHFYIPLKKATGITCKKIPSRKSFEFDMPMKQIRDLLQPENRNISSYQTISLLGI